jgi:hypothetical protein
MNKHVFSRRAVLSRMILPAALVTTATAAEVTWDGSQNPFTLNVNPVYGEGLREGFTNAGDDETTSISAATIGPNNGQGAGISLGLRMAQIAEFPGGFTPDGWATARTWIYGGEVFTGPNGIISFAANNDDTDYLKLDGAVVLNDNGWDTAIGTVVTGLTPNSWVSFEFRVSDTGAGGAGPSGQGTGGGLNWNLTTGAVMSYNNENASRDANAYIGGPNDLGRPTEVANGTPELFRYLVSAGAGGDNIHVTANSTATLTGTGTQVVEGNLTFEKGTTPVTLTFNNSDAVQRTLAATKTVFGNANGATAIFAGTGNVRVGEASDGDFSGITVIKDGGTGDLIFDVVANNLDGATLRANNGRISVLGNGYNPISTLTSPIQISSPAGICGLAELGSDTTPTTFKASVAVNDSGTLEHFSIRQDTLNGDVTIASGKTLNANISGGVLRITGTAFGAGISKSGAGVLRLDGTTQLDNATVSAGTLTLNGNTTLATTPVIASGGTLALTGVGTTYTFPGPLVVPTGGTLRTYAGPAGVRQTNLTGGILILDGEHGLKGEYWNAPPANVANSNPNWGPLPLVQGSGNPNGTNVPGSGDFTGFQNTFAGLGGPGFTVNTTDGGVTGLDFPSVNGAPFIVYGVTYTDNIQARWTGKFFRSCRWRVQHEHDERRWL